MSLTTQTNIVPTNPFFLFFWGTKNRQMITLPQISGKNSPFSQKELAKLPPIVGSL
jgi:hypothetical protein